MSIISRYHLILLDWLYHNLKAKDSEVGPGWISCQGIIESNQ